jgi:pimeloyl-ACP methyl ester carboxylesterase
VGYVEVAGLRTWHEVSGEGYPVVLLHGAFGGAASFHMQTPAIVAAGYRAYVPERRGHAHTPDVEGPLTYSVMADDTINYLDQQVDGRAHLVGWSDGAVVALLVAARRPDLVDRLVLIGQYYNSTGKVVGGMGDEGLSVGDEAMRFLRAGYDPVSPDGPDHFPVVFAKTMHMLRTEPELELAEFTSVTAPTLVLQGDRDEVTIEHSVAVVAALGDARLAVLPGTHALPLEWPDVVNPLIVSWLRGGPQPFDWSGAQT